MFGDIGWTELMLIGVVALIVIGPEDLPEMFRQIGRFTGKLRSMAREFQRAMDQAGRDSGVGSVAKDLKSMTSPTSLGLNAVKEAADKFEKWDPLKAAKSATPTLASALPREVHPAVAAKAPEGEPLSALPETPPAPVEGPATAALRQKKAARQKVMDEMNAKLKAIEAGDLSVVEPKPTRVTAGRTRKPKAPADTPLPPAPKGPKGKKKAPEA